MNETIDIRWQQRFVNFSKAFIALKEATEKEYLSPLEKSGLIQTFEFTFELAWKTLKDYLEAQKVSPKFPRDVIKEAFQYEMIEDGDTWMEMLDKRNLMSHTYDQEKADQACELIIKKYFTAIEQVYLLLQTKL